MDNKVEGEIDLKRKIRFAEEVDGSKNKYRKSTTNRRFDGIDPETGSVKVNTRKVPVGSYNEKTGRYTGDFRGLKVVNPWGGGKRRRKGRKTLKNNKNNKNNKNKNKAKSRRSRG
jgi:hypothetical protein